MNPLCRTASLSALLLSVPVLSAQVVEVPHKQEILKKAREACYNLRSRGLVSFQSGLEPDWDSMLASARKANPEGTDRGVKLLEAIHFHMNLSQDDTVKLTHDAVQAPNDAAAKGLAQVYGGMEQMTQGFFQTWSVFLLSYPFPEPGGSYHLIASGEQYQLTYKDGDAEVVTTLGKDLRITSMKVTSSAFSSLLQPQYEATPQGLLMVGYQADYQTGNAAETTQLQVGIQYKDVDGFKLPSELNLQGSYGGSPFSVRVAFKDIQVVHK